MTFFNFVKLFCVLLLLTIFSSNSLAFGVQVNGVCKYDLNSNLSIAKQVRVTHEKCVYDEGCNFIHCDIAQKLKSRSEKTQGGSFFVFEVGFVATKGGGNNLFRVVDDVELADIKKTGAFRSPAGTLEEGKQFVDNIGDAKALQSKFSKFFGGNQTIVGAKAPQSVLNSSTKQPFADIPKGQAITVPVKSLPKSKT